MESRFSPELRAELENRGHTLNVLGPWLAAGSEVMIEVDQDNRALHGAADPRRDGYAVGW